MKQPTETTRTLAALAGLALGLAPRPALAQTPAPEASDTLVNRDVDPPTAGAAPGPGLGELSALRRVGPLDGEGDSQGRWALAAAGGYGFTESVLHRDDSHHRLLGTLALEWAAWPRLHLGLRLDGRYDRHHLGADPAAPETDPGRTPRDDDGWTGQPQLGARWSHDVGAHTRAGLGLRINLPGGKAPSIDPAAMGGELVASAGRSAGQFDVVAALGYRLDRSAHAVPPRERLSPADRVSLGVNAFDAVVAGLVIGHRRRDLTLFAEASLDVLLGTGHPPASQWPLRFGLGARHPLSPAVTGEIATEISPAGRPSLAAEAPLVDLPPRVALLLGLLWTSTRPRAGADEAAKRSVSGPVAASPPAMPPVGQLRCAVRSFGGVGISATLKILSGPDVVRPSAPMHSRDGTFSIELGPGSYDVLIEAPHFVPQRRTIAVEKNGVTLLNADLRRAK